MVLFNFGSFTHELWINIVAIFYKKKRQGNLLKKNMEKRDIIKKMQFLVNSKLPIKYWHDFARDFEFAWPCISLRQMNFETLEIVEIGTYEFVWICQIFFCLNQTFFCNNVRISWKVEFTAYSFIQSGMLSTFKITWSAAIMFLILKKTLFSLNFFISITLNSVQFFSSAIWAV